MKRSALAVLAMLCGLTSAFAANQGQLAATSTGDFLISAQGPAAPRLVQVLNLSDMPFNNATRSELGASLPGATMNFCVIDTYAGAVNLGVTSTNGASGNPVSRWLLKTTGNDTIDYLASLTLASDNSIIGNTSSGNNFSATVAAGVTVNASGLCGTGNLKFHVGLDAAMPQTAPARTYVDTITVVATPI